MRPSLIPHTFIAKTMRKKYHSQRAGRTWLSFAHESQSFVCIGIGFGFLAFVLYLKYWDKKRQPPPPPPSPPPSPPSPPHKPNVGHLASSSSSSSYMLENSENNGFMFY
jgi:hypothetical protein